MNASSLRGFARVAAVLYPLIILVSLGNFAFVGTPGPAAFAEGGLARFRIGLGVDVAMFVAVVVLAWALFSLLRSVSPAVSTLAFAFRLLEAAMGFFAVLVGLLVAQAQSHGADSSTVDLLLGLRSRAMDLCVLLLCVGTVLFCVVFLRAGTVPRWVAIYGIATFTLMFIGTALNLLVPGMPEWVMAVYAPATLFELAFGGWLLARYR